MNIFKFEIRIADKQTIQMPFESKILDIQMQDGKPCLWAICNPENEYVKFQIFMYGTGWDLPYDIETQNYIGTVQDGRMVWHFFKQK